MKKDEKLTIEDHKKYMDDKVQHFLKPLMVDILKNRPSNVLEYITEWCGTKGLQIQKNAQLHEKPAPIELNKEEIKEEKVAQEQIRKSMQEIEAPNLADLPTSEDETDFHDEAEDEEDEMKIKARTSQTKKKLAISAEAYGTYNQEVEFQAPVIEKNEEQTQRIREVLKMNFMFADLEEHDQEVVIKAMNIRNYEAGDTVIKQGDDGAELFIVSLGLLECTKRFPEKEEDTFLKNYEVGDVFGELALMYNAPRAATIIAKEPSVLFSLDRDSFNHIVKTSTIKRREAHEAFIAKVDILSDLDVYEKAKICDCLKKEVYHESQNVINENEVGDKFYMIQSGEAKAYQKQEDGSEKLVFEYKENDYFGELALINNEQRKATIRVTSEKLEVAALDAKSFKRLLGPIENILKRNSSKYSKYIK